MKEPIFELDRGVVRMRFDDGDDPMYLSMNEKQIREIIKRDPEVEKLYRFYQANRGVKYG